MTVTTLREPSAWTRLPGGEPCLSPWAPQLRAFFDPALGESIAEDLLESSFADYAEEAEFSHLVLAAWSEVVDGLRRFMCGTPIEEVGVTLPIRLAGLQARLGISERTVERSLRVVCRDLRDRWVWFVDEHCRAGDIHQVDALRAVAVFAGHLDDLFDHLMSVLAPAHAHALEMMEESGESVRERVLREAVTGTGLLDEVDLSTQLKHPTGDSHLVVLLSDCGAEACRRRADGIGSALGISGCLHLSVADDVHGLWLTRSEWTAEDVQKVRSHLESHGHTATLAGPESGAEGLRTVYQEAQQTEAVRAARGDDVDAVIRSEDVQLEIMAMRSEEAAHRLIKRELGQLAEMAPAAEKLRETLRVWFALGSHVSTAATLGLHEHTVRNRVRRIETILGHSLYDRRADVQVALRLHRLLLQPKRLATDAGRGSAAHE